MTCSSRALALLLVLSLAVSSEGFRLNRKRAELAEVLVHKEIVAPGAEEPSFAQEEVDGEDHNEEVEDDEETYEGMVDEEGKFGDTDAEANADDSLLVDEEATLGDEQVEDIDVDEDELSEDGKVLEDGDGAATQQFSLEQAGQVTERPTSRPQFKLIKSGDCGTYHRFIFDIADCHKAVKVLRLSSSRVYKNSREDRPVGCYYVPSASTKKLFYNSNRNNMYKAGTRRLEKVRKATSARQIICISNEHDGA